MNDPVTTRRQFTAMTTAAAASLLRARAYAADSDTLRIGLVGCGGRGTGAAINALQADSNIRLVAMGDAFADMIEGSLKTLMSSPASAKVDVPAERRFTGFDAYKQVIDAVDVVCLATPPHFRPMHLKYAVERGVHAFVEKPVATDPAGVRDIFETCQKAAERKLSIVSGLCWRYHQGKRATVARIHEGAIGDIVACETYYLTNQLWHRGRKPQWSEMEYQIRNWLYFDWLSGDFNVEQHVHSLDKVAWAMGDRYPVRVTAQGGRIQRTGQEYGNVYDHFSATYEYADGVKAYSACRQINGCTNAVYDNIMGTTGTATLNGPSGRTDHTIVDRTGKTVWHHETPRGAKDDMYQTEHDELMASIRSGQPINNGAYMCKSTMMGIAARLSAYTGQTVEWESVWNSPLDLSPPQYAWGDAPQRPVAVPGEYKLPA